MNITDFIKANSIADKVNRVLILVLAAMALLIVAYFAVAKWQSDQSDKQNGILNLQIETESLYLEFLAIRQLQAEYLALQSKVLPEGYAETVAKQNISTEELQNKMPTEEAKKTLSEIQSVIAEQNAEFDTITEMVVTLGKDHEHGVVGEMRNAAQEMELQIRKLPASQLKEKLLVSLMTMRRHEKNFGQRRQDLYLDEIDAQVESFQSLLKSSSYSKKTTATLLQHLEEYYNHFEAYANQIFDIETSRVRLGYLSDSLRELFRQLRESIQNYFDDSQKEITKFSNISQIAYGMALIIVAVIIIIFMNSFSKDIISALRELVGVMGKVNDGDLQARTNMTRQDELGQVGSTFDRLLDERIADLNETEAQNNKLNESIINLIQQVGHIANQKDFTTKVPVAGDVTGAVSDSVNLLVQEVSSVLGEVVQISTQVEDSSQVIVSDAEKVVVDSQGARQQVEEASGALENTVKQMAEVSEQSNVVAVWADNTINQTQSAFEAVTKSVDNINNIRDTISETEKRIKRLGERSQEITGIVNLINNIAERTHILALNASMHAASAGEAGRGFAVVADEVQRLAENAREATAEISTLVNNIHVETTDTVTIMNKVISEVADGTRLAGEAGQLMSETKVNTTELVSAVKHIAEDATSQAAQAADIRTRIQNIEAVTRLIDDRLAEQKKNTDQMERFASQLARSVSVFTLASDEN